MAALVAAAFFAAALRAAFFVESGAGTGGCFLAGVHLEWLFAVVGLLLMLTLVIAVQAEEYIWLVFVVSAVAVVGLFFLRRWLARKHKAGAVGA